MRSQLYATHRHNFEIQNELVSKGKKLLSRKVVADIKLEPVMPDEDKTFSGS